MASRIAPTADATPKRQRRPRQHAEKHLVWIRTLPSVVSGIYGCEACHIRYASRPHAKRETGMAEKPDDCWTVPLTPSEHRAQHAGSERLWWLSCGIDPLDIALRLWQASGDDERGELICMEAARRAR